VKSDEENIYFVTSWLAAVKDIIIMIYAGTFNEQVSGHVLCRTSCFWWQSGWSILYWVAILTKRYYWLPGGDAQW